jgi:hypothetical protein
MPSPALLARTLFPVEPRPRARLARRASRSGGLSSLVALGCAALPLAVMVHVTLTTV